MAGVAGDAPQRQIGTLERQQRRRVADRRGQVILAVAVRHEVDLDRDRGDQQRGRQRRHVARIGLHVEHRNRRRGRARHMNDGLSRRVDLHQRIVQLELVLAAGIERDRVRLLAGAGPDRDLVAAVVTLEAGRVGHVQGAVVDVVTADVLVVHPRQRAVSHAGGQRCVWPTRRLHRASGQRGDRVTGDAEHRRVLGLPSGPGVARRALSADGQVVAGVDPRRVGDLDRHRVAQSRARTHVGREGGGGEGRSGGRGLDPVRHDERGVEDADLCIGRAVERLEVLVGALRHRLWISDYSWRQTDSDVLELTDRVPEGIGSHRERRR